MIQPILRVQVQGRGVHSLQSATRAWDWVKNRMMLSQGPQSTAQDCLRILRNFTVNFMKLHNCTVQTWPQLQRSDWRRGAAAARQLGRAIRLCFISLIKPSERRNVSSGNVNSKLQTAGVRWLLAAVASCLDTATALRRGESIPGDLSISGSMCRMGGMIDREPGSVSPPPLM